MKEIIKILKNYRFDKKDFFAYLFIWMISEVSYLFLPKIWKEIINVIEIKWNINDLYFWIIILALFSIVFAFIAFIWEYFSTKLWLITYSRKSQYYREILFKKNYKDIINTWTWKLISRLWDWISSEMDIYLWILNIFVNAIFRWILVLIILIFIIPKLTLVIIIWIFIIFIFNYYSRKVFQKYNKIEQKLWEEDWRIKTRMIMENLIIRIFLKKNYELKKSKKILDEIPKCWIIVDTINNSFYKMLEVTIRLLEVWTYIVLWALAIRWEYSIANITMVTWYIWFLWWPIDKAVSNLNRINRVWEKYSKLQRFLDKLIEIIDWENDFVFKNWKIEFKDLFFSYENNLEIFKNFNLEFLEGKKNALVWHSWGGKSTIFKIILRLYDYKSWKVLIDWQELKTLKIDSFYENIWYLPQDAAIFDWTIRENLEYAFLDNYKYDDEEIWLALKKAKIDDMIKSLEKWLETEVWERWIKLSGWEKQRLAIARIFLKNPKIILLDEPTSALDSINEAKITKTLSELMKWRTSIIIAHRLQTVMNADKIIVIENWKIEKTWTHEELIENSKTYKKLVNLQNGVIEE